MHRLVLYAAPDPTILLSAFFYIGNWHESQPAYAVNSLTAHRLLITSLTIAAKTLSDNHRRNSCYARIGGISVRELALLELNLLSSIDWVVLPSSQSLQQLYTRLVDESQSYTFITNGN
jgi:hypothetical protein